MLISTLCFIFIWFIIGNYFALEELTALAAMIKAYKFAEAKDIFGTTKGKRFLRWFILTICSPVFCVASWLIRFKVSVAATVLRVRVDTAKLEEGIKEDVN